MTNEEAIAYFKECNENLVSVAKDENVYDYEKQVIETDCMRRTFEANEMAIKVLEQQQSEDMGEVSDGHHTFNQLYHQRAVLFATIVNQNKDKSWKSFKHSDGNYCFDSNGEWFIVGIDTPQGSYTYHYAKEYWGIFDCQELECGKEWDGHTEEDVTRLLSLEQQPCEDCISRQKALDTIGNVPDYDDGMVWEALSHAQRDVALLPSVTPKGVTVTDFADKCRECGKIQNELAEDAVSRSELLSHDFIITAQNGISHRVIYATRVEEAPSVIPQRKRGKWIFREDMGHQYCCSECGCPKPFVNDYYYKKIIGCPYCLADMSGGEEDEDGKSL